MKRNGMCPICFVKRFFSKPSKVSEVYPDELYGGIDHPPMGWSSWNTFKNNIDEDLIYDTALALKNNGLVDAGYTYVNIDDNWVSNNRDENGCMVGDPLTFKNGMPSLIKKINDLGIKVGVYSSNGTATCEDLTASLYHEWTDALTFARWGVEYFKYDFCHNIQMPKYAPLIYGITINKEGTCGTFYDISNVRLSGLARKMKNKNVPQGKYVSGLDRREGAVEFSNILVDDDGEYYLTIHIFKKGAYRKCLMVEVNDKERYIVDFPEQKKFNYTAKFAVKIKLNKGANSIKMFNPISSRADSAMLQYINMGRQLKKATEYVAKESGQNVKPITFSICEWGFNEPYKWGRFAGNVWRTTPDIRPVWSWIKLIYGHNVKLQKYSCIGAYNDPDMLEVGNGKLTHEENRSHFALWCMMDSPLILGNDIRSISPEVLSIVTNKYLIGINQDKLGIQAKRIVKGSVDILLKPLSDGSSAVCIFNKGGNKVYNLNIDKLIKSNFSSIEKKEKYIVLDCWNGDEKEEGREIKVPLRQHDSQVFIIR